MRLSSAAPCAGLFLLLCLLASCADDEPISEATAPIVGACDYESPFTQLPECREYVGSLWKEDGVREACDTLSGTLEVGGRCAIEQLLGRCAIDTDTEAGIVIFAYGDEAGDCAGQQMGCETFGGGTWEPEPMCGGTMPGGGGSGNVFIQPTLVCSDPLAGEPEGASVDGQVCTWQAISGATEAGRRFVDYASCDVVRTQRPYYTAPPAEASGEDPRLADADYAAELAWVRSQIEATACVCCHGDDAPNGASNWSIDAPGNWMNTFRDSGLALGASWVDSVALGAYPAEENNGFDRSVSGFPSTDPQRMRDFFIAELAHRGLTEADFVDAPPFGGPIYDQLQYTPAACESGEGVRSDGQVVWEGGPARYVYVLEARADNPTVPPNLDLPDGTIWRLDVPHTGMPVDSGEVYFGDLPNDEVIQRFPASGAPASLEPGTDYYLYVTVDVGIPITRCVFTF